MLDFRGISISKSNTTQNPKRKKTNERNTNWKHQNKRKTNIFVRHVVHTNGMDIGSIWKDSVNWWLSECVRMYSLANWHEFQSIISDLNCRKVQKGYVMNWSLDHGLITCISKDFWFLVLEFIIIFLIKYLYIRSRIDNIKN